MIGIDIEPLTIYSNALKGSDWSFTVLDERNKLIDFIGRHPRFPSVSNGGVGFESPFTSRADFCPIVIVALFPIPTLEPTSISLVKKHSPGNFCSKFFE
ncbi:hypothetical protein [Xenorhabdus eapokensis]|uniref:hypothetical protein n=1 Tax=Xenorhabdus eapokensis TaxID=1873482 RepID=UPI001160F092|nr:hypothetical protein [Xenorhabdus eapokensis]